MTRWMRLALEAVEFLLACERLGRDMKPRRRTNLLRMKIYRQGRIGPWEGGVRSLPMVLGDK